MAQRFRSIEASEKIELAI